MGNAGSSIRDYDADLRKFSHFFPGDVKDWIASFIKTFPAGHMTRLDLEKTLRDLFPFGDPSKFSNFLFKAINIGQTECIDTNEFLIAFSILVKGSRFEKLRWIFRFFDTDSDGVVSQRDVEEVVSSIKAMANDLEIPSSIVETIFRHLEHHNEFLTFNDFEILDNRRSRNGK
jgi:Ca2+-binding EF-hand superfamily protein